MEISDVFLRNEGYVWREIDGEAILMSPYGDQIHALNDVGTFIWKLMNGYNSIGDITDQLCEEYEVIKEQALSDLLRFLERLLDIKAIRTS